MTRSIGHPSAWDYISGFRASPEPLNQLAREDFIVQVNAVTNDYVASKLDSPKAFEQLQALFKNNPGWAFQIYPEIPKSGIELRRWMEEWRRDF
ncbi:MAG TPA: hypothetical protein VJR29_03220 [bacterium]|nr:hypothetical protein [bacterium]